MAKGATRTRLERLEELKGLLARDDHATQGALARELGISLRTVARDIEVLRDGGMPIESDRGRGGGLRLARGWRSGRVHFDHAEAIDLLLSLAIAERVGSPLFLHSLGAIRRKIAAAFADREMDRIGELRRRILLGGPASGAVLSGYEAPVRAGIMADVARAFVERRVVEIDYRGAAGTVASRRVEPHYLLYNPPVWYLLAFDHLRGDVRSFRIDRIVAAVPGETRFRLRPRAPFLAAADPRFETL